MYISSALCIIKQCLAPFQTKVILCTLCLKCLPKQKLLSPKHSLKLFYKYSEAHKITFLLASKWNDRLITQMSQRERERTKKNLHPRFSSQPLENEACLIQTIKRDETMVLTKCDSFHSSPNKMNVLHTIALGCAIKSAEQAKQQSSHYLYILYAWQKKKFFHKNTIFPFSSFCIPFSRITTVFDKNPPHQPPSAH